MAFNKLSCLVCGNLAQSEKEFTIGTERVLRLKCGHLMRQKELDASDPNKIESLDGKSLYPFQAAGVRFVEQSSARCLIADEMGLGKTVQALGTIRLHPELAPFLCIVKSSLKTQWQHEIMRWCGEDYLAQIIEDGKTPLLPGLKAYIISFDLLKSFAEKSPVGKRPELRGKNKLTEQIERLGLKTLIIDECQAIKNPESIRAKEVRDLSKSFEHIIALSGTPIKNNASEYFSILNILKPELYPVYARFVYNECDSYWNGFAYKSGGLKNAKSFLERTKSFIIRRERAEVLPDLPVITRNFNFSDLSKEVEAAYLQTLKEFQDEYNFGSSSKKFGEDNILAYLTKMRHLTGLSKIEPCLDFITDFLFSTDRKLTVFVHHKDVGEILKMKLSALLKDAGMREALSLTADLSTDARAAVVNEFMSGETRVLIASTLASGEGLNLQKCSDCIMLERQWNPANEEQAEGRFIRIGQIADKVTATYFVAVGTVDEFFAEIVERKREIVKKTLSGEAIKWDQSSLITELAEVLAMKGGRKWGF